MHVHRKGSHKDSGRKGLWAHQGARSLEKAKLPDSSLKSPELRKQPSAVSATRLRCGAMAALATSLEMNQKPMVSRPTLFSQKFFSSQRPLQESAQLLPSTPPGPGWRTSSGLRSFAGKLEKGVLLRLQ